MMRFTFATLALFVVDASAQCSAVSFGTEATALGTAVDGLNKELTYAFKGETAPTNGLMCYGCAIKKENDKAGSDGNWYTADTVEANTDAPKNGFLCTETGCKEVAQGDSTPEQGTFYSSDTIQSGTSATEPGVLCPLIAQGTCEEKTCVATAAFTEAPCLGTACVGNTAACTAVISGYEAPQNGVYCSGCAYKKQGDTAEIDGIWWAPEDAGVGDKAPSKGIFCPSSGEPCEPIEKDTPAQVDGKLYMYKQINAGAPAPSDGVLCPPATTTTATTTAAAALGESTASSIALPLFMILGIFLGSL